MYLLRLDTYPVLPPPKLREQDHIAFTKGECILMDESILTEEYASMNAKEVKDLIRDVFNNKDSGDIDDNMHERLMHVVKNWRDDTQKLNWTEPINVRTFNVE
jgi:hypothetical protein